MFLTNFFNHAYKPLVDNQVQILTRNLSADSNIKVLHTPVVFPLGTSNQLGGYARSLGFSFGPKFIAINVERLMEESAAVKKFILTRQIALFDKNSRCLHIPLAAVTVGIAFIASTLLFPSSIVTAASIASIAALASGILMSKSEQKNEKYADRQAFSNLEGWEKEQVLQLFREKMQKEVNEPYSFFKTIQKKLSIENASYVERHAALYDQYNLEALRS